MVSDDATHIAHSINMLALTIAIGNLAVIIAIAVIASAITYK